MRRRAQILISVALILLMTVGLIEGSVALMLSHPAHLGPLRRILEDFYFLFDRNIIHADLKFSRYDPELLYTLRPGRFIFSEREFRVEFRVNSLGVRDDEESLFGPEVVVLGDSVAMGWGVKQEETFAKLVERETGMRVLNAAVSSYGTVREMLLLARIDTRRLKYLIIQYHVNDFDENMSFREHGNTYVPKGERDFVQIATEYQARRRYYPGKYSLEVMKKLARSVRRRLARSPVSLQAPPSDEAAALFINALVKTRTVDLSRVKLIVFAVGSPNAGDGESFTKSLRRELSTGSHPELRTTTLLDFNPMLTPEHFYVLDDHFNSKGQKLIADGLVAAIRRLEARR